MNGFREASQDFVRGAKGVAGAVDLLRTAIAGGDPSDIEFAVGIVANAADSYTGKTAAYHQFGLDEMAATPQTALPKRERVASDILASALVDLQIANTLIAAEQSAENPGKAEALASLDTSIGDLNELTNKVALPLGKPVSTLTPTSRFGLDEAPVLLDLGPSADLATAKARYEKRTVGVCDTLVTDSKKVVQACFEAVRGFDKDDIADAISKLGKSALALPQVGNLVARGLLLASQALEKLTKLFGVESGDALRELAQKILGYISEGVDLMDTFLRHTYGIADTKQRVRTLLDNTQAEIERIDEGSKKLAELQDRFAEQMAVVFRIVNGVNAGKRITGFFLPGATTIWFFGTLYFLAMDYAVFAGMDFADSIGLLSFVDGILEISTSTLT